MAEVINNNLACIDPPIEAGKTIRLTNPDGVLEGTHEMDDEFVTVSRAEAFDYSSDMAHESVCFRDRAGITWRPAKYFTVKESHFNYKWDISSSNNELFNVEDEDVISLYINYRDINEIDSAIEALTEIKKILHS